MKQTKYGKRQRKMLADTNMSKLDLRVSEASQWDKHNLGFK